MSLTNRELVNQAIAAIGPWMAFLDQKEAEQDAMLAEVRLEKKEPSGPFSALSSRFRRKKEKNVPTAELPAEENEPSHNADSAASLLQESLFDEPSELDEPGGLDESGELDSVAPHSFDDSSSKFDAPPSVDHKEQELDAEPSGDEEREFGAEPSEDDKKLKEENEDYKFDDLF